MAIHPRLQVERAELFIATRHINQRAGVGEPKQQRTEQGERERESVCVCMYV